MPLADEKLTAHFYLSQLVVSPIYGRAGIRNAPLGPQVANLRRLAQHLEQVQMFLHGAPVHVLRALRAPTLMPGGQVDPAVEGRSVDFVAPAFGSPREVCAHLVAQGLGFDRLVNAAGWVQLDIPRHGADPLRQLQTGIFESGQPMRYVEGLL